MPATQIERLPESILAWQRVLTHVHTAGSSTCSGQQTLDDVERMARALGFEAVVLAEHTTSPERPKHIRMSSPEGNIILDAADQVEARFGSLNQGYIRHGLECNIAPLVSVPSYLPGHSVNVEFSLDASDEILNHFHSSYVVGSLHGDAGMYKNPVALMTALQMLCEHPHVDAIGHITRHVSDVKIDWAEVAQMAADSGTILELNQNLWFKECCPKNVLEPADSFNMRFHRGFVEAVAGTKVHLVIGADVHNEGMWPTAEAKPGDWRTSVESVIAYHEFLASCGLRASRMLNSDLAWFDRMLWIPKPSRAGILFRLQPTRYTANYRSS